jgi:hypothetical protein
LAKAVKRPVNDYTVSWCGPEIERTRGFASVHSKEPAEGRARGKEKWR